jgi:hypothetical protein
MIANAMGTIANVMEIIVIATLHGDAKLLGRINSSQILLFNS